jgi:hypothetical protein
MGVRIGVDDARSVFYADFEGVVSDELISAFYREAQGYISSKTKSGLIDFSNVTEANIGAGTIRKLAESPPLAPEGLPRVVVAPQDLIFGMMRMFEGIGAETREDLRIVRSLEEAYKFLNIDELEIRTLCELDQGQSGEIRSISPGLQHE